MNLIKIVSLSLFLLIAGCETVKLGTLEKLGYEKREILTSRVEKAKDSQEEAKQQFQSALQEFQNLTQFNGGKLEDIYERLNDEYEASKKHSEAVSERIDSVEYVAEKLFSEWKSELKEYSRSDLRKKSEAQLIKTQKKYATLLKSMRKVEKSIQPVLSVFNDQVLYLKHNLNAQAIAALKNELATMKTNVNQLIAQMNTSISEANQFIQQMEN